MKPLIRVVLIEDDDVIRKGYEFLINETEGYSVCNAYVSFEEAIKSIHVDLPDVILLDIDLPGINGVDAIPKLKKAVPKSNILILTVYDSEKTVFNALSNGASGYITKNTPSSIIISSIKDVKEGGGPMSTNIARMVIKSFQKNQNPPLSKREMQVLEFVAVGKSRTHIANELFIDLETVKTHIKNIYIKLNVNSKEDALKAARENKLI
jgi:DNA-binding NarL/FixJ family response regulator